VIGGILTNRIVYKKELAPGIFLMDVEAPLVAEKARAGQFVILMTGEKGERIPITIADYDPKRGTVRMVFQVVGKTTAELSTMKVGDTLYSFVGPLGRPSKIDKYGTVAVVGGGTGVASIYPIARALNEAGNRVISIIGAKTRNLVIMEEEMRSVSAKVVVTTDDGSYGKRGFVTEALREVLKEEDVKKVWVVGPAIMMKVACDVTRPYNVETIVSLNAIMVDGTGMCGTCRVTVSGKTKFTCVDGPEFDGHSVDWDEFLNRLNRYRAQEQLAFELHKRRS